MYLEKRDTIYGICTLWIIIFHVYGKVSMPYVPIITEVVSIGNMGVDIFLFFSGLCLALSANKKENQNNRWTNYFKRRSLRILLPYFIICFPFYMYFVLFECGGDFGMKITAFFMHISSLSYWLQGYTITWYVYCILICYIIFPFIYSFMVRHEKKESFCMILLVILLVLIISNISIIKKNMSLISRLPIFMIGSMWGIYGHNQASKVKTILSCMFLTFLILVQTLTMRSSTFAMVGVVKYLLYIPATLSFVYLLLQYGRKNRALGFVGYLSLEAYLVHVTILFPLMRLGLTGFFGYWMYLILPVISIVVSCLIKFVENKITKDLFHFI